MVARNANQEIVTFPVSENIHQNEILHLSIVPARISTALQERAREMAKQIAEQLDLKGILGVEMFVAHDGRIYINELAPRPHNSGHFSLEPATSPSSPSTTGRSATGRYHSQRY